MKPHPSPDCSSCPAGATCFFEMIHRLDGPGFLANRKVAFFPHGKRISPNGCFGQGIYSVCSGLAKLECTDEQGRVVYKRLIGPGQMVLELLGTLDGDGHPPYVFIAGEPSLVSHLSTTSLKAILHHQVDLALGVFSTVSRVLEEYRDILALRGVAGATNRVLAALGMISRKRGADEQGVAVSGQTVSGNGNGATHLHVTHQDIADLCGLKRNTVSVVMKRLREKSGLSRR